MRERERERQMANDIFVGVVNYYLPIQKKKYTIN